MYTILGVIAKPLGWLLSLLYDLVGNYGISIDDYNKVKELIIRDVHD